MQNLFEANENVLDIYQRPYESQNPWICFDESCKQLVKETREPIQAEPRKLERYDYQYERNGVANLFMFFEPLTGWRHVEVTERRTAIDYAHQMKYLVDERYPQADKIGIIQDQLNTHVKASLYKAFEPKEAKRILDKLEFHYTPKHGSWLQVRVPLRQSIGSADSRIFDSGMPPGIAGAIRRSFGTAANSSSRDAGSHLNMAEIELSVVNRQCLNRRLPDQDTLKLEIAAWSEERNQKSHSVNWRFTTADARFKLKRLYPSIQT